jgi:hypothetical protein
MYNKTGADAQKVTDNGVTIIAFRHFIFLAVFPSYPQRTRTHCCDNIMKHHYYKPTFYFITLLAGPPLAALCNPTAKVAGNANCWLTHHGHRLTVQRHLVPPQIQDNAFPLMFSREITHAYSDNQGAGVAQAV